MIRLERVSKTYGQGYGEVTALDDVSLDIPRGQYLAVMGPSGSGKSTLINLIAALDVATRGQIFVDDVCLSGMSDGDVTLLRRRKIGMVFQLFNLLPTLTAEENVALPLLLDGQRLKGVRERVRSVLELVGLGHRARHRPSELSGGEMQRVAIARALVADPPVLLADEPTGNLDTRTGHDILGIIRDANRRRGQTVVLVTHDVRVARQADRIVTIVDGRVADDVPGDAARSATVASGR